MRSAAQGGGIPAEVDFRTKPEVALEQLQWAYATGLPRGVVLMDAGYGNNNDLRREIAALFRIVSFCKLKNNKRATVTAASHARRAAAAEWTRSSRAVVVQMPCFLLSFAPFGLARVEQHEAGRVLQSAPARRT
ncbi:transposase [Bradyrhizobium sp. BEA-2-5]|uniref:transposase n=1 Tax=Bradyrhizobium sp. BEA-2-5 TaxID=3080015 RepID=UPI00293F7263|nr:transposase [Bradyrhizobium sp. BEA-2-5]WOH85438.1 transposase [Bradyrhizobium sp. BEA-2-5]